MTTDSKFRIGSAASTTDTTAFDIDISGESRTPTAVVGMACLATSIDSNTNDAGIVYGISDFSTNACNGMGEDHDEPDFTDVNHQHSSTVFLALYEAGSITLARSWSVAAKAGGITVTPIQSGTAWRMGFIIIFGAETHAFTGQSGTISDADTFSVTHTLSGTPNGGIYFLNEQFDSTVNRASMSIGFHSDEGAVAQGATAYFSPHFQSTTQSLAHTRNDLVGMFLDNNGNFDWGYDIQSNDGTSTVFEFDTLIGDVTGPALTGLLIFSDDVQFSHSIVNSHNNAGTDWNYNALSWQPQIAIGAMNMLSTINSGTGTDVGAFNMFAFDEDGTELANEFASDDGLVQPTNPDTHSRHSTNLWLSVEDGSGAQFDFTNPTFTTDGFDVANADMTTMNTTVRLWPMLFVEQAAAGVTVTDVDGDETWDDGDSGLVVTGTGFV